MFTRYFVILIILVGYLNAQTYLLNQNFEGTGYDNSEVWTESNVNAFNEDYAVTPLRGSQSMLATQQASFFTNLSPTVTSSTEVWLYFMLRIDQAPSVLTNLVSFTTSATQFGLNTATGKFYMSANAGTTKIDGATSYVIGTTYYVWIHLKNSTNMTLYLSTDGVKPSLPDLNITSGVTATAVTNIRFSTVNNMIYVVDWLLLDDEAIGTLVEVASEKKIGFGGYNNYLK